MVDVLCWLGGGECKVGRTVRWLVAGLVTAAVFGGATWICGAYLLPPVMASSADRWVVAAGLGVAVAAFAALWGKWWATQEESILPTSGPGAWDEFFRGRPTGFVRARLKSGAWVGGWYGKQGSYASAYPNGADLYLESAYEMRSDGSFGPRVKGTGGLYLRMEDIEVLEFVEAPPNRPEESTSSEKKEEQSG